MEGNKERYSNPLIERYASAEMGGVLSDFNKFRTWRRCWIALAEAEAELGLAISKEQLDELRAKLIGVLQAPATKLAGVTQAPAAKLARVFSAYGSQGDAA